MLKNLFLKIGLVFFKAGFLFISKVFWNLGRLPDHTADNFIAVELLQDVSFYEI